MEQWRNGEVSAEAADLSVHRPIQESKRLFTDDSRCLPRRGPKVDLPCFTLLSDDGTRRPTETRAGSIAKCVGGGTNPRQESDTWRPNASR